MTSNPVPRSKPLVRLFALLAVFACAITFAPRALAIEIQVEVLFDSLAQPPAPVSNICTLRKAVNNASDNLATYPQCQAGEGGGIVDTIVFNVPGTITFALGGPPEDGGESGDLDVTGALTIIGHPDGTTIDAADLGRVFHVHPGATLTLVNIHITNGNENSGGGGIRVDPGATLNLNGVTISSCHTGHADGGGIVADGATLNITNSTITGNTTPHHGAGIAVSGGTTNITNSTITANHNQTGLAGGISGGAINLRSSIIAGNTNASIVDTSPNITANITSLGYNVIGSLGTPPNHAVYAAQPTDQVGVTGAQLNLGPLQNNGGPTPTHAPGAGSVAIDKGHSSGATTDQRGSTRPCDLAAVTNAAGGDGGDSGAVEVQGTCAGSNQPPDAVNDSASVFEDSGANLFAVLSNDTDPEADALSVTAVTQGAGGSVAVVPGGVAYTPNPNFFGNDSFTYTVSDGTAADTATVNVSVAPVPDAPDAVNDSASVNEDSGPTTVFALANDVDVDGDALSVVGVSQGANGSVANNGGTVSYTPNPNFFGADSFTYTVSDGQGGLDTATVSVSVVNVPDAPAAEDDSYSMNQDTTLTVAAPGVLGNDSDADGDALSSVVVTTTSNGSLVPSAGGSFTYTPNPGFTGTDAFTYRADDGGLGSNVATVTITIADTQGPNLSSSVAATSLRPPNHNMVNVGLNVTANDNGGGPVQINVAVYSDEDDVMPDFDDHSPDAKDIAPLTLRLRAERTGAGDGRVYLIVITATDGSGNASRNCLAVVVPKSNSQSDIASVNQQAAAALAYCVANGAAPANYFVVGDGPVVGPKQ